MDSEEGTYGKFLNVLLTAKKERWKPSKVSVMIEECSLSSKCPLPTLWGSHFACCGISGIV